MVGGALSSALARAEGLLLTALGLAMTAMAGGDAYWLLFNPRYAWVTALGGALVAVAGLALALAPASRPKTSRALCMALFLAILALYRPLELNPPKARPQSFQPSRETLNGREYVRINAAELFLLIRNGEPDKLALPYTLQGLARRTPELDARSEIALLRVAVTCCLADAVALGVRVRVANPRAVEDGSWVAVHGRLERLEQDAGRTAANGVPGDLRVQNLFLASLADGWALFADKLEKSREPGLLYVFEFRDREPYAY